MRLISAADIDAALTPARIVAALEEAFRSDAAAPPRHLHGLAGARGAEPATLLLMPAWDDRHIAVKVLTLHPDNAARGLATIQGGLLLSERATGLTLAAIDAPRLTLWRTAGASALAARHLARPDAARLLMVGAGALAPFLVRAHAAVRPIRDVAVWNRRPEPALRLAADLAAEGLPARAVEDLEAAARAADLISCATLSEAPLVRGAWLSPGTHLDLVGAFTPRMREVDDEALRRAEIYVDTADALSKGGDVAAALASGAIAPGAVRGSLADLCRGSAPGRASPDAVTAFKSVGSAVEDLAAAVAVWRWTGAGAA
ncbi:Ornithine cyclodeaminase [Methylobacterium sp. 4-46]|uniref:ornithine cyclodeaminase family protein n=1 Tax=unclassified Methylobacterium TaxID=2615210 RepID=UPI000152D437|nr:MULTISPECIES: ornithine cyclodeaminase family protein [Methylobacterium]ACA16955.1 Ornithine cyclodeaminase [Methylobacterium sp. 4-46]WFT82641.1 ornithine cyclodeaminase family protein [Methylobacterium nodulans]